jgi:hypothetical protein
MQPGAHLDPQFADALTDIERAPDGASWTIERCVEAVTRGVDLDPMPSLQRLPNDGVVALDQLLPRVAADG